MSARLATPLCSLMGIALPIIQAPIGSATTPELVAAVSRAGGLGTLAATWLTDGELERRIGRTRELTDRPFGVNLVLAFPIRDKLDICLSRAVPMISTAWGDPGLVSAAIRESGALHLHACGSVLEAEQAVESGVDVVVAQGWEAGGHVLGTTSSMALIPAVVDAVSPTPVIAAGGIGDGRGIAAALVLGAQAAWLGTRFLVAAEANTHAVYRESIMSANAESTEHSRCFVDGWDAPHRALRNSTLSEWDAAGRPPGPGRPGEGDVLAVDGQDRRWLRYEDMMPITGMQGDLEAMAMYAGQSAGLIHDIQPAEAIVQQLASEARWALDERRLPDGSR